MHASPDCSCSFEVTLHGGVALTLLVTVNQTVLKDELLYSNPGLPATAARNFSCSVVYDADVMNCTWSRGAAAPWDVQYHLYLRPSRQGVSTERECPSYMARAGTHLGCLLRGLSGFPFRTYFLVNGSSRLGAVQFFDAILSMKDMERFSPPANTSVQCNASHCLIRWTQPRTLQRLSYLDFQYQLDIHRESLEPTSSEFWIEVPGAVENMYTFPCPEPRVRHAVRVRAADSRLLQWSAWSQPVHFGFDPETGGLMRVSLLVVLGTLVCALLLGFVVNRYFRTCGLFSRIPQVRDKWNDQPDADHQVAWDKLPTGPGDGENEQVLTVEEVSQDSDRRL
ncbi:granulocyte-macrophage colony-stimulating factor receptor subunit alpha isoform X2 [Ochotona curzoniae]|nr:granulocyte-macrophage colony-stimulating factor receptor subunit alpha isoform X2 [Ochotona curzoniae]XP_040818700.1 granulocyte-macrophage colony-stimulating factor receptor subunit alpha isoform X2 [Ochotona curzoniae]